MGLDRSEEFGVEDVREVRDKMGIVVVLEVRVVEGEAVKDAVIH